MNLHRTPWTKGPASYNKSVYYQLIALWILCEAMLGGIIHAFPVIDGRRFFMDAHSRIQFRMEAGETEKAILSIGRYNFSKAAFEQAAEIIRQSINKNGGLVIDEIGPLELRKKGFHPVIRESLKNHTAKLLFVIRENLVGEVTELFELKEYEIITKENLDQL